MAAGTLQYMETALVLKQLYVVFLPAQWPSGRVSVGSNPERVIPKT